MVIIYPHKGTLHAAFVYPPSEDENPSRPEPSARTTVVNRHAVWFSDRHRGLRWPAACDLRAASLPTQAPSKPPAELPASNMLAHLHTLRRRSSLCLPRLLHERRTISVHNATPHPVNSSPTRSRAEMEGRAPLPRVCQNHVSNVRNGSEQEHRRQSMH